MIVIIILLLTVIGQSITAPLPGSSINVEELGSFIVGLTTYSLNNTVMLKLDKSNTDKKSFKIKLILNNSREKVLTLINNTISEKNDLPARNIELNLNIQLTHNHTQTPTFTSTLTNIKQSATKFLLNGLYK